MLKTATLTYGYANDDVLNDTVSMFGIMFCSIGEIMGPLFGGFVTDNAGSDAAFNVAALMTFAFAIVFAVGSETFNTFFDKKQSFDNLEDKNGITNNLNERLLN